MLIPTMVIPRVFPLRAVVLASSLVLALAGAAFAQPDLYGPEAPSDVAFLRVLNASSAPITMSIADAAEGELQPGEGSEYVPVPGDDVGFTIRRGADAEPEVTTPEAGSEEFLTLLVVDDATRVLRDEVLRDISRGLLVFVNATGGEPLSLRLGDGTLVFEEVGEEPVARTIAEAEAEFEVVSASSGEVVGRLPARTYERGAAHTILVYEDEEGPAVSYLAASLAD